MQKIQLNLPETTSFYTRLTDIKDVGLDPTFGTQRIQTSPQLFENIIIHENNQLFKVWSPRETQRETGSTEIAIYEQRLHEQGSLGQMINSFGTNSRHLCFTEDQVVEFCSSEHTAKLLVAGPNSSNTFLFEISNFVFVARMSAHETFQKQKVIVYRPDRMDAKFLTYPGSSSRLFLPTSYEES